MGYEVRLHDGRAIRLDVLYQWRTYAGLLEGLPTEELNRRLVTEALDRVRERLGTAAAYLIPPVEQLIEGPKSYLGGRFGRLAQLPAIVCAATFDSFQPAQDAQADGSSLTVVWFQDDFALPIDKAVLDQLQAIDWVSHAHDGYY
jgi:hypothetical protein